MTFRPDNARAKLVASDQAARPASVDYGYPNCNYLGLDERGASLREIGRQMAGESEPEREPWHQLLIIGNGFDLACGLRSSFWNFKAARDECFTCARRDGGYGDAGDGCPTFAKNAWDVMLDSAGGTGWANVERQIERWIVPGSRGKSMLDRTAELIGNRVRFGDYGTKVDADARALAEYLLEGRSAGDREWPARRVKSLVRADLTSLEGEFSRFLSSQIEATPAYPRDGAKLLHDLLMDERPEGKMIDARESVLSFNYTRPVPLPQSGRRVIPYANVHGRLGGEVVFGIDGAGRMRMGDVATYTKTYRLMAMGWPDRASIVRVPQAGEPSETRLVKFFGHSLAAADHSYFQAIFDAVDLYGGQTRLIFYYRPFGGHPEQEVRRDVLESAIRLLDGYGRSLDNRAHGRNLVHKLLLEGRLSVKLLPTDGWQPDPEGVDDDE